MNAGTTGNSSGAIERNRKCAEAHQGTGCFLFVAGGEGRQWLTEAAGYAVFTPTDGSPTLRVAVYAAPKPVSAMHAGTTNFNIKKNSRRIGFIAARGHRYQYGSKLRRSDSTS